jgi:hypothetical protein
LHGARGNKKRENVEKRRKDANKKKKKKLKRQKIIKFERSQ